METATIVTLGNSTSPTATSFTEAFGEYSEARGRGRARRQKRRMERIANRKTRRKARQDMRLDKKRSRVQARTERRQMRADSREQRRDQKAEGKRSRERADLEQEREFAPDETTEGSYEQDAGYAPQGGYDDGGYAPQGGGYTEDQGGYAPQGGYTEDQGGYAEDQGGYSEEGGYQEEGGYEEGGYDDGGGYEDESYYEESDGFDGVMGTDNEMIDVPYSPQVNQNVADAAKRIEWNLELASRLKEKAKTNPSPKITGAIYNSEKRVNQLESCLDGYCNFEGDFTSDADGKMMFQKKRKLSNEERRKRRSEIRAAKLAARKERNAMRRKSGLTPVQMDLNPQISQNSIVIPAKELGSSATGIIGLDDAMDYDASATEIKLGADGGTSKIPFKAIGIGLVAGALVIFVLRKYKVI
jgi:hypothetical protein